MKPWLIVPTGHSVCAIVVWNRDFTVNMNDAAMASSISVRGLTVSYPLAGGNFLALDQLDLNVTSGSSVAIMGPSGCGKSTLLSMLAGLGTPTAGSVVICGQLLDTLDEEKRVSFRRRNIGMVYQTDNLLPFLTVIENIRLQLALCGDTDNAAERCAALLERLGLGSLADRLPDQLSGGQRQRAAIVRAIVCKPAVLLADEPTGALDADNATAVVSMLLDARRVANTTLIVVTHDAAVAKRMDRHLVLRAGRITAEGDGPPGTASSSNAR
jgi:putative ABC transport system ATP-binding protein